MYDTINEQFTGVAARQVNCWCGVAFAVPRSLFDYYTRRNDEKPGSYSLYCPLGHAMIPAGESEADRLREELAKKERDAQQLRESNARLHGYWDEAEERRRAAERSVRGHKAVVTRMKRRVAAGSCPCCSKKFKNLEEHMKAEHPKWDPDRAAAELAAKAEG